MYDKILELVRLYAKESNLDGAARKAAVHAAVIEYLDSDECLWDDNVPDVVIDYAIEFVYNQLVKGRNRCALPCFRR
jgi:hypothetical protein